MLTKSKSTLLKSIAMIVTLIMVVCVCLTACADQTARDTAKEAKEVAEKAQSSLDASLKDYVKKEEVSAMIEDALNKFMTDDGLKMVTDALKTEAGSKVISEAVSSAINEKLTDAVSEEQIAKIITDALENPDSAISASITNALNGYLTETSAKELVDNALDEFLKNKINSEDGAIAAALENYKTVVSDLVEDKIGTDVSAFLKTEEAQQILSDCFSQLKVNGSKTAIEAAAKIVKYQNRVTKEHWTAADAAELAKAKKNLIDPLFTVAGSDPAQTAYGETDIVQLLFLINTCDQKTLSDSVNQFAAIVDSRVSVEQAAAEVQAMIDELGTNVNGELDETFATTRLFPNNATESNIVYMIVFNDGVHTYFTSANPAKLAKEAEGRTYGGFKMTVDDEYYFSMVQLDGNVSVEKLIAPNLDDAEKIAAIKDAMQKIAEKFGDDYDYLRVAVGAIPDDQRTEADDGAAATYKYNGNAVYADNGKPVFVNYPFMVDYENILDTINNSAKNTLAAIENFYKWAGENGENIATDTKLVNADYKAAQDNYKLYNDSRYTNVIDGVDEAMEKFNKFVDDKVAAATEDARQKQLKKWADDYKAAVAEEEAKYWANAESLFSDINQIVADFHSKYFGEAVSAEESVALAAWAENYKKNYKTTMAHAAEPEVTIDGVYPNDYDTVVNAMRARYAEYTNEINSVVVAPDGYVWKELNEIDARFWFEPIRDREADRVKETLTNFANTDLGKWGNTTDKNDIADIAADLVTKKYNYIKSYTVDTNKAYPYSTALDEFCDMFSTREKVVEVFKPLELWFNVNFTVFEDTDVPSIPGTPALATAPAVADYKSYKAYLLEDLNAYYGTLKTATFVYTTERPATYWQEYLKKYDAVYASLTTDINKITVKNDDYQAAIDAADAALEASKRELQKAVYEILIDIKMKEVNAQINIILSTYYMPLYAADPTIDFVELNKFIEKYTLTIVPSHTLDNSYADTDPDKLDDAAAYNAAIAAIDAEYNNCAREMAKSYYEKLLAKKYADLGEDVLDIVADAISAYGEDYPGDVYGVLTVITEQMTDLLNNVELTIADDASATNAYLDAFKAAYDAKCAEVDAAVTDFEAMVEFAVDETIALNGMVNDYLLAAKGIYDQLAHDYDLYDYQKLLKKAYNAVVDAINATAVKLPTHKEADPDDSTKEIDVYDTVTMTTLTAAFATANDTLTAAYTGYESNMTAYKALMDEYKAALVTLAEKKEYIKNNINKFLQSYLEAGAEGGRFVDVNPEIYWATDADVFDKGSPIELGLRKALTEIDNVVLNMVKEETDDGYVYYTPAEALKNAIAAAVYDETDPADPVVTTEGGALWKVLDDCIPDEKKQIGKVSVGTTKFVYQLNLWLNRY